MTTQLRIPAISGRVHLGCTAQERKKAQPVSLEILIDFKKTPKACTSDLLKDTPCYAEMTKSVLSSFQKKHYATIEHLCLECFLDLKKYLKILSFLKRSQLKITITKKHPPVKAIEGGSQFSISEIL